MFLESFQEFLETFRVIPSGFLALESCRSAPYRGDQARHPKVSGSDPRSSEAATAAPASGPVFARRPRIAFFLHDEVIVHCPREHAEEVAEAVRDAAAAAGRLLFGDFPVDFPLEVRIADSAQKG